MKLLMIGLAIGTFIGIIAGVLLMCLLAINKERRMK